MKQFRGPLVKNGKSSSRPAQGVCLKERGHCRPPVGHRIGLADRNVRAPARSPYLRPATGGRKTVFSGMGGCLSLTPRFSAVGATLEQTPQPLQRCIVAGKPLRRFRGVAEERPAADCPYPDPRKVSVRLVLKGGGCENEGAQYSLPNEKLKANRDLDGCRKAILDAVLQAQGKGCGPGILGVCIGGDRASGYEFSKQQFLRELGDSNPNPELDKLERDIVETANKLGIGPMGFGGKTTLLGVKICVANRVPASYFVSVSYRCWAFRRQGVTLDANSAIEKWLY